MSYSLVFYLHSLKQCFDIGRIVHGKIKQFVNKRHCVIKKIFLILLHKASWSSLYDMHPTNIVKFYLTFEIMEIIFDRFISWAFLFIIISILNRKFLFQISKISYYLHKVKQHIIVEFHIYILTNGINMRRGAIFKLYLKMRHF